MATRKPAKKKSSHFWLRAFFALFGLGIALVLTVAIVIMVSYPKLPSMTDLRNYQPKLPLEVYSADGVQLGQFGDEHRIFISYDHTPKMLIDAILAAEDERYFKHGGIDYIGVLRAVISNITSGHIQSGASTITMQVTRNFFLSSKRTYSRKFEELLLADKMERSISKEQILELYINQIYLGERSYGFAEASLTYFGKPLDKLSIAQYAILAGLPKAPSAYNPVVNLKRSLERQHYVLERMLVNHFITQEEYKKALAQKIIITRGSLRDATDYGSYVAEMVRQMLYAKYGDKIYTQGYKVYTTVDSKTQQEAYGSLRAGLLQYSDSRGYHGASEQLDLTDNSYGDSTDEIIASEFDDLVDYGDLQAAIVTDADRTKVVVELRNGSSVTFTDKQLDFVRHYLTDGGDKQIKRGAVVYVRNVNNKWQISQVPSVEGALVALDPNTGAIRALIGGFDFAKSSFNHVVQAYRQPGSSFKPFIYSAALEHGFSADTKIDDSPVCYPSGGPDNNGQWCPKNDESDFLGSITLREALARSRNVPTVKILDQITPQVAIDYVSKFGFDKSQFQPYLTMALGANEATPLQMATAYAVFANGGYFVNPYLVQKITDSNGNILAQTEDVNIHNSHPVIDPRNAYILNSMLQDVVRYGTGAKAYQEMHRDDIAGKTGTTTDAKDVWFDGYTPNLVAVTWVGYDQPKTLGSHQFGATLALPIWINFMEQALNGKPQVQLGMPSGITMKQNDTWQGNAEYVYDGSKADITQQSNESGSIITESSNATNATDDESDDVGSSDNSTQKNSDTANTAGGSNDVATKNQPTPTDKGNPEHKTPDNMEDLIRSLQDQ